MLLAALQSYTLDPAACQEFVHTGIIYENVAPLNRGTWEIA